MAFFFNPLCGYPLKKGAKGVAIFDLVTAISFLLLQIYFLDVDMFDSDVEDVVSNLNLTKLENETHQEKLEEIYRSLAVNYYGGVIVVANLIGIIMFIGDAWLSRKLWRATNSGNTTALIVWMAGRTMYIILSIFVEVYIIFDSDPHTVFNWTFLAVDFVQIFGIVVVNEFRKELLASGPTERI